MTPSSVYENVVLIIAYFNAVTRFHCMLLRDKETKLMNSYWLIISGNNPPHAEYWTLNGFLLGLLMVILECIYLFRLSTREKLNTLYYVKF